MLIEACFALHLLQETAAIVRKSMKDKNAVEKLRFIHQKKLLRLLKGEFEADPELQDVSEVQPAKEMFEGDMVLIAIPISTSDFKDVTGFAMMVYSKKQTVVRPLYIPNARAPALGYNNNVITAGSWISWSTMLHTINNSQRDTMLRMADYAMVYVKDKWRNFMEATSVALSLFPLDEKDDKNAEASGSGKKEVSGSGKAEKEQDDTVDSKAKVKGKNKGNSKTAQAKKSGSKRFRAHIDSDDDDEDDEDIDDMSHDE
jgi:hypothetical protein